MYSLIKSDKKVKDLNEGDSVIVYAKGLPFLTKFSPFNFGRQFIIFLSSWFKFIS